MARDRLQVLTDLENAGLKARWRAVAWAWGSVGVAALLLAALVNYGGNKIKEKQAELVRLDGIVEGKQTQITTLETARRRLESRNEELKKENQNLELVRDNYAAIAAPQSEANLVPEPVPPGPADDPPRRAYLQIVHPDDRQYADAIGKRLGRHGFRVMGVELVERAARLKNTEVRYYKKVDEVGAARLVDALKEEGVASPALLYLNLEGNTRVRRNHYEVWFAAGVGRSQPVQPDR